MSRCSACGAPFSCAMSDPGDDRPCGCAAVPALPAAAIAALADITGAHCLCPTCLSAAAAVMHPPSAE